MRTAWSSAAAARASTPPPSPRLEKGQKTRAKRRHLDVVDRGLMDLVSVYRDAIALAAGAPGRLVNEEMRGDIDELVRTSTPELNLRRISWIFEAREQMLEFNVPVALALESMMVALQVPGPERQVKQDPRRGPRDRDAAHAAWAPSPCCSPASYDEPGSVDAARTSRPPPPSRPRPRPPSRGPGAVLLPGARLVVLPRRRPLRDPHGAAGLPAPGRPTPSTWPCSRCRRSDPAQPDRLAGGQPRRSRRPGHGLRRQRRAGVRASRCSTATTSSGSTRAAPAAATPWTA